MPIPGPRFLLVSLSLLGLMGVLGHVAPGQAPPADDGDPPAEAQPPSLWDRLDDTQASVRVQAYRELVSQREELVDTLVDRLADPRPGVRYAVVVLLADPEWDPPIDDAVLLRALVRCLDDDADAVRTAARHALLSGADVERAAMLESLTADFPLLAEVLLDMARHLRLRVLFDGFRRYVTPHSSGGVRIPGQFTSLLERYDWGLEVLLAFIEDPSSVERAEIGGGSLVDLMALAVFALGDSGDPRCIPILENLWSRYGGNSALRAFRFGVGGTLYIGGGGDLTQIAPIVAVQLYRLGVTGPAEDYLRRIEEQYTGSVSSQFGYYLAYYNIEMERYGLAFRQLTEGLQAAEGGQWFPEQNAHLQLAILAALGITADTVSEDGVTVDPLPDPPDDGSLPAHYRIALDHLTNACEMGYRDVEALELDPRLDPIRDTEEYQALAQRLRILYYPPETDEDGATDDE